MNVQKRIVSTKRHTIGYVVDEKVMTRGKVVKLARRGKINGVTARKGKYSWFVASLPSSTKKLYALPETVIRRRSRRAAKK